MAGASGTEYLLELMERISAYMRSPSVEAWAGCTGLLSWRGVPGRVAVRGDGAVADAVVLSRGGCQNGVICIWGERTV